MVSWYHRNIAVLSELHSARGTKSRYPVDLSHPYDCDFSHLKKVRNAFLLASIDAAQRTEQGEITNAVRSTLLILRIGDSLSGEPTFMANGYMSWADDNACRRINRILNCSALATSDCERLERALARHEAGNGTFRAWVGERAGIVPLLVEVYRPKLTNGISSLRSRVFLAVIAQQERDMRLYLEGIQARIAFAEHPDATVFSRATARDEYEEKVVRRNFAFVSAIGLIPSKNIVVNEAHFRALVRIARTALALERYRNANGGAIPESLSALVPGFLSAVPVDPFDDRPLKFKRTDKGYTIYSIGRNLVDDGGNEDVPGRMTGTNGRADLTFSVNRR